MLHHGPAFLFYVHGGACTHARVGSAAMEEACRLARYSAYPRPLGCIWVSCWLSGPRANRYHRALLACCGVVLICSGLPWRVASGPCNRSLVSSSIVSTTGSARTHRTDVHPPHPISLPSHTHFPSRVRPRRSNRERAVGLSAAHLPPRAQTHFPVSVEVTTVAVSSHHHLSLSVSSCLCASSSRFPPSRPLRALPPSHTKSLTLTHSPLAPSDWVSPRCVSCLPMLAWSAPHINS